jgi:cell wall-associated NlpC family hydrolase
LPASAAQAANGAALGKWAAVVGTSKLWVCAGALLATAVSGYVMLSNPAATRTKVPTRPAAPITALPMTSASPLQPAPITAAQKPLVAEQAAQPPVIAASTAQPAASREPDAQDAVSIAASAQTALSAPGTAHRPAVPSDKSTHRAAAPKVHADTLDAELDLLHRAQLAWRERDAANALRLLKQHRAHYPHSGLQLERDTLQVLTLCELGQRAHATRLARTLMGRAAHSPLRASLEESCALK